MPRSLMYALVAAIAALSAGRSPAFSGTPLAARQAPAGSGGAVASLSPYIDVHAHIEPQPAEASVESAGAAMTAENARTIIFLPPPETSEAAPFDVEQLRDDQHYPPPANGTQRWQSAVRLLNQLPDDLRRKVAMENAVSIYRLESKRQ